MDVLKKARVCGRPLEISVFTGELPQRSERRGKPFGGRSFGGERGEHRGRGEGRDRPFGNDRGDFKRGPRKFDKGGRRDH